MLGTCSATKLHLQVSQHLVFVCRIESFFFFINIGTVNVHNFSPYLSLRGTKSRVLCRPSTYSMNYASSRNTFASVLQREHCLTWRLFMCGYHSLGWIWRCVSLDETFLKTKNNTSGNHLGCPLLLLANYESWQTISILYDNFALKICYIFFSVCVCVWLVQWSACRGQKTTCRSWVFPFSVSVSPETSQGAKCGGQPHYITSDIIANTHSTLFLGYELLPGVSEEEQGFHCILFN